MVNVLDPENKFSVELKFLSVKGALSCILTDICIAKIYICVVGNAKIMVQYYWYLLY